jgi:hypothetical protein
VDKRELTTDEGTEAYRRMVGEIVRENFTALDTSGEWSRRDAVEDDHKDHMDLGEFEAAFKQADKFLEGIWYIAESTNPVAVMVVSDARQRTRNALERVQEFRATWG